MVSELCLLPVLLEPRAFAASLIFLRDSSDILFPFIGGINVSLLRIQAAFNFSLFVMYNTKIEWCDATFNPWEGCTKVSPGCAHCYAETRNKRFGGGTAQNWGKGAPRRRTSVQNWNKVRRWNREAGEAFAVYANARAVWQTEEAMTLRGFTRPRRPRVFCASIADWLDAEVPIAWRVDLLDLIRVCTQLDFLLLSKRPQHWRSLLELARDYAADRLHRNEALCDWLNEWLEDGTPPANCWIGTTVEDQQRANERIPQILRIPARVRFLSCEPLLEHLDLTDACGGAAISVRLDWVIAGGESGPGARPMNPDWARSLRDQCAAAKVAFFMKQMGGTKKPFPPIPADLFVREFPR